MSSSSSSSFSPPDHHQTLIQSSDQLCYVHCNFCDTVLAVSVPSSSLLKTVAVRCGHCTNLLSVNMRALLLHPSTHPPLSSLLEEISSGAPLPSLNTMVNSINDVTVVSGAEQEQHQIPKMVQIQQPKRVDEMLNTFSKHHTSLLAVNRPPEKRQRVPSAYNRFIKEEIQRIKAGNPDISHREAFSAAAKNWAHLPHIHLGLMPADKQYQKPNLLPRQALQEADDEVVMAASR